MLIFGALAVAAGVLTFFLPETQNQPLPETLEEAINYPMKGKPKEDNIGEESKLLLSKSNTNYSVDF